MVMTRVLPSRDRSNDLGGKQNPAPIGNGLSTAISTSSSPLSLWACPWSTSWRSMGSSRVASQIFRERWVNCQPAALGRVAGGWWPRGGKRAPGDAEATGCCLKLHSPCLSFPCYENSGSDARQWGCAAGEEGAWAECLVGSMVQGKEGARAELAVPALRHKSCPGCGDGIPQPPQLGGRAERRGQGRAGQSPGRAGRSPGRARRERSCPRPLVLSRGGSRRAPAGAETTPPSPPAAAAPRSWRGSPGKFLAAERRARCAGGLLRER